MPENPPPTPNGITLPQDTIALCMVLGEMLRGNDRVVTTLRSILEKVPPSAHDMAVFRDVIQVVLSNAGADTGTTPLRAPATVD